jgi:hypothetical protein
VYYPQYIWVDLGQPLGGPSISISDPPPVFEETNASLADTFTVTLSSASTDTITVHYATQDGTAKAGTDYTAETGTLTFAPGQTLATGIPITNHILYFETEAFNAVLSNPVDIGGSTPTISDATGTATLYNPLFTTGADKVYFNNLTSDQVIAISAAPTQLYDALGGNDTVILPTEVNGVYQLTAQDGSAVNVTWDQPFIVGAAITDTSANIDTVTGSGDYQIQIVGFATVSVTLTNQNSDNQSGGNNITVGSGADTINITGNGNNQITAESGNDFINISGNGNNTITCGTGADVITFTLTGATPPIETISNFNSDDKLIIDQLVSQPNLTLSTFSPTGKQSVGSVYVYSGQNEVAQLNIVGPLAGTLDYYLEPISVGNASTQIRIENPSKALSNPQFSGGNGINWNIIDAHEGGNWLDPYVPFTAAAAEGQKSGVTIAIGVDLANGITQGQFASIFKDYASNPNLHYLYNAALRAMTGKYALDYLKPPNGAIQTIRTIDSFDPAWTAVDPASVSISITQSQTNELTNWAQQNTATEVERLWNAYTSSFVWAGTPILSSLPWQAQTGFVDVAYNSGTKLDKSARTF